MGFRPRSKIQQLQGSEGRLSSQAHRGGDRGVYKGGDVALRGLLDPKNRVGGEVH